MFGKPEWFGKRDIGVGFSPASWQGWAYYAGWGAAVVLPLCLLALFSKWPEAAIWTVSASGVFAWDARRLKKQTKRKQELENLLYIGDEADSHASTRNYELHVRR